MDGAIKAQHGSDHRQLVVFYVAGETYGVDIHHVKEIIRVPAITRVPKTPDFVEGVINLRGSVIPVLDLRKRFGFEPGEANNDQRIVVIEIDDQTVGVIVDSVTEVLKVDTADIGPPSPYVVSVESQYISGIAKLNDQLIILLDVNRVLTTTEREAFAEFVGDVQNTE